MITIVEIPKKEREILSWYLRKGRNGEFCFEESKEEIFSSPYGFDAFSVYYIKKKQNKMLPTKQPKILKLIYDVEEGVQNMAKGIAFDFRNNILNSSSVDRICDKHRMPTWFKDLVYRYRNEYWGDYDI